MSDAEIWDINKDDVSGIINELKQFLMLSMEEEDVYKACEETQLVLSLKFVKSPFMKKKLNGL